MEETHKKKWVKNSEERSKFENGVKLQFCKYWEVYSIILVVEKGRRKGVEKQAKEKEKEKWVKIKIERLERERGWESKD